MIGPLGRYPTDVDRTSLHDDLCGPERSVLFLLERDIGGILERLESVQFVCHVFLDRHVAGGDQIRREFARIGRTVPSSDSGSLARLEGARGESVLPDSPGARQSTGSRRRSRSIVVT